ncbi:bifunctional 4-hydroxy-2-oxoglutarate aldolase/2-dehydro-3-deoxy-phosphogluconate aldolase [Zhouia sp. PK063]|uniref:bifunctional 4-hydroxy-2-oxoglutarate aldolase/2-dehydro-3-deoxy-phosphogluconate aldolase n=1 Tax=Zhouia sp. PK063 TaxID=3373602 RepID=UPI0037AAD33D
MATFTRIEVVQMMHKTGIVPVFYHKDVEVCKKILQACYKGGIRVFEFTNRGELAHETFREILLFAKQNAPEMMLGIGSVVDAATAALYMQIGANFVVSPICNPEIASVCNRRKIAWIPGCGSATEISNAEALGAEIVKIFPAKQVGGSDFIKAVKGPMPWSSIMPTGGITLENSSLKKWFIAGAWCVGVGSQLFIKNEDDTYNYKAIQKQVSISLAEIEQWR